MTKAILLFGLISFTLFSGECDELLGKFLSNEHKEEIRQVLDFDAKNIEKIEKSSFWNYRYEAQKKELQAIYDAYYKKTSLPAGFQLPVEKKKWVRQVISETQLEFQLDLKYGFFVLPTPHEKPFYRIVELAKNESAILFFFPANIYKHEAYAREVITHEVGHIFLHQHLMENNYFYRRLIENHDRMNTLSLLSDHNPEIRDNYNIVTETIKSYYDLKHSKEVEYSFLNAKYLYSAMHELFADLVSAVSADNSHAMSRPLQELGVNDKEAYLRSFDVSPTDLEKFRNGVTMSYNFLTHSPKQHIALSLVRNAIWKKYVTKYKGMKKEFLENVARLISNEIDHFIHIEYQGPKPLITGNLKLLESVNFKLIENIDKSL